MIIKIAAVLIFLPWLLCHEYQWLIKRWGWRKVRGKIIARPEAVNIGESLMDYFVVELMAAGKPQQAKAYDLQLLKGNRQEVRCVVSPEGKVEIYSTAQRLLGSLVPIGMLAFFIF